MLRDDVSLQAWSKQWLETAGLNTLRPEFTVSGSGASAVLTDVVIHQTAIAAHPTLRIHKVTVAAFDNAGTLLFEQDVLVKGQVRALCSLQNE